MGLRLTYHGAYHAPYPPTHRMMSNLKEKWSMQILQRILRSEDCHDP